MCFSLCRAQQPSCHADVKKQPLFAGFPHTSASKRHSGHDSSVAWVTATLGTSLAMTHLSNWKPLGQRLVQKQGTEMRALDRKHSWPRGHQQHRKGYMALVECLPLSGTFLLS